MSPQQWAEYTCLMTHPNVAGYLLTLMGNPVVSGVVQGTHAPNEALLPQRTQPKKDLVIGSIIPQENRSNTFTNFKLDRYATEKSREIMGDALRKVKDFCDNPFQESKGLYIHGNPGVGKSHFAMACVDYFSNSGRKVLFMKGDQVYSELGMIYGVGHQVGGPKTHPRKLFKEKDVQVVVIDDLNEIDFPSMIANLILSSFDFGMVRFVVTSNVSCQTFLETIVPSLGEKEEHRIYSRLNTMFQRIDLSSVPAIHRPG